MAFKYMTVQGGGRYWLDKLYEGGPHKVSDEVYEQAFALMKVGAPLDVFKSDEDLEPKGTARIPRGPLTLKDVLHGNDQEPPEEPEEPEAPPADPLPDPTRFACGQCEKDYASEAALDRHVERNHPAAPEPAPVEEPLGEIVPPIIQEEVHDGPQE